MGAHASRLTGSLLLPLLYLIDSYSRLETRSESWCLRKVFRDSEISMFQSLAHDPLVSDWPSLLVKVQIPTQTHPGAPVFTAASVIIDKWWKQFNCPSTEDWISKTYSMYAIEYYSPQRGRKLWYVLQHGWTLKTLCFWRPGRWEIIRWRFRLGRQESSGDRGHRLLHNHVKALTPFDCTLNIKTVNILLSILYKKKPRPKQNKTKNTGQIPGFHAGLLNQKIERKR